MLSNPPQPFLPTYQGYVDSVFDALLLFESCLNDVLNHTPRQPRENERQQLSQSGNIFIYEEHSSGIKRWTDDISWSSGRVFGSFLIYRELGEPETQGEQDQPLKLPRHSASEVHRPDIVAGTAASSSLVDILIPHDEQVSQEKVSLDSLDDSNNLKADGLIKKTISVTIRGVTHHLVSYYFVDDVLSNRLSRPSGDIFFQHTIPRIELLQGTNARTSVEKVCAAEGISRAFPSRPAQPDPRETRPSRTIHRGALAWITHPAVVTDPDRGCRHDDF